MQNINGRKWTVFFLVKSVDEVADAIEMIKDLLEVAYGDDVSIVLCLNVPENSREAIETGEVVLLMDMPKEPLTTLFYSLIKNDNPSEKRLNKLEFIKEQKDFDITAPEMLAGFFTKCITGKFAAERYIIFTWDHGSRYGIFSGTTPQNDGGMRQPFDKQQNLNHVIEKVVDPMQNVIPFIAIKSGRRLFDNSSGLQSPAMDNMISTINKSSLEGAPAILTMEELAEAIQRSFGNKKIDIVIMMNCHMQFFDAGYALRNNVKYFVAPENYMHFNGYNYTAIFSLLSGEPSAPAVKIARKAVTSFSTKKYIDVDLGFANKESTILYASDLSYYSLIASLIDELSSDLAKKIPVNKKEIVMARASIFPIHSGSPAIDFFNLLYNLRKTLGRNWAWWIILRLEWATRLMIKESHIGLSFAHLKKKKFPSGFTIFFPIDLIDIISQRESLEPFKATAFYKENSWRIIASSFLINSKPEIPAGAKVENAV